MPPVGLCPVGVGVFRQGISAPDAERRAEPAQCLNRACGEPGPAGLQRGEKLLGVDPALPPSARRYPPGPVLMRARSPSARRIRLTRISMLPSASAGGCSGQSTSAIMSLETSLPRCSASSRSIRRASLPPNARSAISCPSRSTANRPSSLILITGADGARADRAPAGEESGADWCSPLMTVMAVHWSGRPNASLLRVVLPCHAPAIVLPAAAGEFAGRNPPA